MSNLIKALQNGSPHEKLLTFENYIQTITRNKKIPISVQLELSPLCNFNCKMCYVRISKKEADLMGGILSVYQWKNIISQIKDLGTNTLTFSGGECMMYEGFSELYSYAYDLGFDISLLTNGSLLTDEILDLICKRPTKRLQITLYGFSNEDYQKTTGNGANFERVLQNIERLVNHKISVGLQCTVTQDNIDSLPLMNAYANRLGIPFIYTSDIKNTRNCTLTDVNKTRVNENKLFAIERLFRDDVDKRNNPPLAKIPSLEMIAPMGMPCAAGNSSFHINWKGEMTPCPTFDAFSVSVIQSSVQTVWEQLIEWANNVPSLIECLMCPFRLRCVLCPAIHYNDTKEFGKVSDRLCWKKKFPEEAAKLDTEYEELIKVKKDSSC